MYTEEKPVFTPFLTLYAQRIPWRNPRPRLFNPLRPKESGYIRNSREFGREFSLRANFATSVENEGMALQLASCDDQDPSTATVSTINKFNI